MSAPSVTKLIDPAQVKIDLEVNPLDIDTAMLRQPGLFAHYATIAAKCDREVHKYEQFADITEAKIDREIRDKAAADGEKITEARIKAIVQADPRMVQVRLRLNEAIEQASIAKSTAEAFRHRRDMLIQIAFNAREEIKGAIRVMGDDKVRQQSEVRQMRMESLREAQRLARQETAGFDH